MLIIWATSVQSFVIHAYCTNEDQDFEWLWILQYKSWDRCLHP